MSAPSFNTLHQYFMDANPIEETLPFNFPATDSEMMKHIQSMDWSRTSLGDPARWTGSLKMCLRIMMHSRQPMSIWWGSELLMIYNDAYQKILGGKHPEALGRPAAFVWSEVWNEIGPRAEKVICEHVGTYDQALPLITTINGYREQAYYTLSLNPIPDDQGGTAGIFCSVTDETSAILSERYAKTLADLLKNISNCRTEHEVYVMALQVLKENISEPNFAFIYQIEYDGILSRISNTISLPADNNRHVRDIDNTLREQPGLLSQIIVSNIPQVIDNFGSNHVQQTSETQHQSKALVVPLSEPTEKFPFAIFVTGLAPSFEPAEKYIQFFRSAASHITDTIAILRNREHLNRPLLNLLRRAPVAMTILRGPLFVIEMANERVLEYWGRSIEEVLNKPLFEALPEASGQGLEELLQKVYNEGERLAGHEQTIDLLRNNKLETTYVSFVYEPLREENGKISGIMVMANEVTDLVISRQKTEESEIRYRHLIQSLPVALYTCDAHGRIELYNKQAVNLWGRKPEVGKDMWCGAWKAYHKDGSPCPIEDCPMAVTFRNGKAVRGVEIIIERPDGTRVHVLPYPEPILSLSGKVVGAINMVVDITEIKRVEEALRESEKRFRSVANTAPVIIWMTDQEKRCSFLNNQWIEFSGVSVTDGLDDGWMQRIHPEDRDRIQVIFDNAFQARKEYNMEFRLKHKDGEYRWVSDHGTPRYATDESFLGFIGTCVDITGQRAAKQQLEKLVDQRTYELVKKNAELKQQKDFVEVIIDASIDLIVVFDRETRIISMNNKCEQTFRLKKEEVIGKKYLDLFPDLKDSQSHKDLLRALGGELVHNECYKSVESERYLENFLIPLKEPSDEVYAALIIAHDITDYVTATENLQKSNEELLRTNYELEQFAYIASHDLQEPLRKIQTFTELLDKNLIDKDIARKYLQKIDLSAARMSLLIKDVLNYSRLSKSDEQFIETDLNEILENVKTDFELMIDQKRATITNPKLPVIKGVPLQLHQLFYNLIGNALKFTEKDPVIEIFVRKLSRSEKRKHIHLDNSRDYIELGFKDNGIGFDQKYAEHIFTIFRRLNNRSSYSGTGIGLALCKKIVENHEGVIRASSEINKGSLFNIYLPIT